jgi:hypothetical protein
MTEALEALAAAELATAAPEPALAAAGRLAQITPDAQAVLYYGSTLRTGELDGILDFYVLTRRPPKGLKGLASRILWPDVSYHEIDGPAGLVRAKVATMTLAQFAGATRGEGIDTTVWTRFAQPARLVWSLDAAVGAEVARAVARAQIAAAGFAAALGPAQGPAEAYWLALFRQTYAAEFRVEAGGRERSIIASNLDRYEKVLPLAWHAGGIGYDLLEDGEVMPLLSRKHRRSVLAQWRLRRAFGQPLNIARLAKATFTFEGAARYAAWKIERHTGVAVPLTPWRERYPLLAAPGVLWSLWRRRRA